MGNKKGRSFQDKYGARSRQADQARKAKSTAGKIPLPKGPKGPPQPPRPPMADFEYQERTWEVGNRKLRYPDPNHPEATHASVLSFHRLPGVEAVANPPPGGTAVAVAVELQAKPHEIEDRKRMREWQPFAVRKRFGLPPPKLDFVDLWTILHTSGNYERYKHLIYEENPGRYNSRVPGRFIDQSPRHVPSGVAGQEGTYVEQHTDPITPWPKPRRREEQDHYTGADYSEYGYGDPYDALED